MKENIIGPGFILTRDVSDQASLPRETVAFWAKFLGSSKKEPVVIDGKTKDISKLPVLTA